MTAGNKYRWHSLGTCPNIFFTSRPGAVTKLQSMASLRFHIDPTFTGYGKSGVRLLKIKRSGKYHDIKQIEVATELKLANHQDYMAGNNASVIPTDTQKNTIYALAKDHPVGRLLDFCNFSIHGFKLKQAVLQSIAGLLI